jgi:putative Holliday junction resolvase
MARIMAIDYGGKRTGIAVTDPLQIIANGLTTVDTATIMAFLKKYCTDEPVERFVVGEPKNLDGSATHATGLVEKFVVQLQQQFPAIPITRIDERFTSKMAFQTMIDSGLKKKDRRNKALVDEISATILLQNYLQMR